ncbi:histidinol-phosphatase HisJ family protein [Fumia xinanensis]|uniref:Histidinol-phosphatase n=1 Tax=Fumia xinanensis TaxID=2763659 RepID=A0A926I696_9FIRM|nr:histidinol-phosphatase HisJ family protein [Fumia xinanensis]MBC8558616.1 histidinol-phosphatase HisJ family protein [Fumia xinanensis]
MYSLIDCHNHSIYSFDAVDTVEAMCLRAEELGLTAFALTDHSDLNGKNLTECIETVGQSVDKVEQFRSTHSLQCELLTGLELGEAVDYPKDAKVMVKLRSYDVIIGSYHNSPNGEDYYYIDVQKMSDMEIRTSLQGYFQKLIETVQNTELDVLAHITYPLRYVVGDQGRRIFLSDYEEQLHLLLTSIINRGIALEVNTSGLRQKIGEPLPNKTILQKYRELGGTMVSLGSDSHNTRDLAKGIKECTQLLSELGFTNITYFRQRQPVFVPIG